MQSHARASRHQRSPCHALLAVRLTSSPAHRTPALAPAQGARCLRLTVAAVSTPEKVGAPGNAFATWKQPAGKGMGWYTGEDGYLYVDNMRVDDIRAQVPLVVVLQPCSLSVQQWCATLT